MYNELGESDMTAQVKATTIDHNREAADLAQIKTILRRALGAKRYAVYLFGSRATGSARPASDYDIAVSADEDISRELSVARGWLEDSNIPVKVDVVDLRLAAQSFRLAAQTQGVLLWRN